MSQVLDVRGSSDRGYGFGRILVVDGPYSDRDILVEGITDDGYEVAACGDGDALRSFEQTRPHLVMVASDLPGHAAVRLCAWLRARSHVPIMVIHRKSSDVDPVRLLELGADRVIRVPVSAAELTARVRAMLRRTRKSITYADEISFATLRLDTARRSLHVDGEAFSLEGRELVLAELLLSGGSKVTSRAHLMSAMNVTESELDGCVRRLRERLEAVEGWRRIVSQRGVGFRLLENPPSL